MLDVLPRSHIDQHTMRDKNAPTLINDFGKQHPFAIWRKIAHLALNGLDCMVGLGLEIVDHDPAGAIGGSCVVIEYSQFAAIRRPVWAVAKLLVVFEQRRGNARRDIEHPDTRCTGSHTRS